MQTLRSSSPVLSTPPPRKRDQSRMDKPNDINAPMKRRDPRVRVSLSNSTLANSNLRRTLSFDEDDNKKEQEQEQMPPLRQLSAIVRPRRTKVIPETESDTESDPDTDSSYSEGQDDDQEQK